MTIQREQLLKIEQQFESPLYIYDTNKMISQYNRLKNTFSEISKLSIKYAVKALSNISVLKLLIKEGCGLDTVSIQEVMLGIEAGCSPKNIIYTPNGVSLKEIEAAAKMGVQINIDNLSVLEQFGAKHPQIPVCVRLNPHVMAGGNSKISVGHIDSKFGISVYQVPHILRIVENTNMKINGLHIHTGSDILNIDTFLQVADILFDLAIKFEQLEFIDFGSGFKVPYEDGDSQTDLEELGKKLSKKFNQFCKSYGRELELSFEPGKFLVSESGYFLVKTNIIKQTTSSVFVGVDSGFNHFIRPMFYGAKHHISNLSNPDGKQCFYSVVGYICETDTFANDIKLPQVNEGDILCFRNAGAYCFSMASNYNSRYRPAEVLWYKDKAHLIRKRETFEDLLRSQVVIEL